MKSLKVKFLLSLVLLLMSGYGYSQVNTNYQSDLEKYLYPKLDTTATKEIVLFVSMPFGDVPEQSVRIIERPNQSVVEVRILSKNLWSEGYNRMFRRNDGKPIETCFYSAPVSEEFKNRMKDAFSRAIVLHQGTIKPKKVAHKTLRYYKGVEIGVDEIEGTDIFDGTSYEFRVNDKGKNSSVKISCPLDSTDFRSKVVAANLKLINDLKNDSFDESKYDL